MDSLHYELDAALDQKHWWYVGRRLVLQRLIEAYLPSFDPARCILEVGCSAGGNLEMLGRFGRIEGLEMFPAAAAVARRRFPAIPVREGAIPVPLNERWDVIAMFDVLEHIDDERAAVDWLADHLKPGGLLFCAVPAYMFLWSRHDERAHHCRRYTCDQLASVLSTRFDVDYTSYMNTLLFPPIALVRGLQRLLGWDGNGDDKEAGGSQPLINAALCKVFAAERFLIPHMRLPFGVSAFAVGKVRP